MSDGFKREEKFRRTLVHVEKLDEQSVTFYLAGWNHEVSFTQPRSVFPEPLRSALEPDLRFHVYATTGLEEADRIKFRDWEWDGANAIQQNEKIRQMQAEIVQKQVIVDDSPFRDFLRERIDTVPQTVIDATIQLWDRLRIDAPGVELSISMATPDEDDGDSLSMTWRSDEMTLSVSVFGTEKCEWFFRDHKSNIYGGIDTIINDGFPVTHGFQGTVDHFRLRWS